MMDILTRINHDDVSQAPLTVLKQRTREAIANSLDSRKLLLSPLGYHRDWRGLADYAGLDSSLIRCSRISFTQYCIELWSQKCELNLMVNLWDALEKMDRFDTIDDTLHLIYDDYDKMQALVPSPLSDHTTHCDGRGSDNSLTNDDVNNLKNGQPLQIYDALVLYVDEDLKFVETLVEELEGKYCLKLCLKNRNLLYGLQECTAMLKLIEERRCIRVLMVISNAFLKSSENTFLSRFAHSLSINQRQRIIIPCMVEACKKPSEISYCHSLDFFRSNGYWDCWKKLAESIVNDKLKSPPNPGLRNHSTTQIVQSNVSTQRNLLNESRKNCNEAPKTTSMIDSPSANAMKQDNNLTHSLPNVTDNELNLTTVSHRTTTNIALSFTQDVRSSILTSIQRVNPFKRKKRNKALL